MKKKPTPAYVKRLFKKKYRLTIWKNKQGDWVAHVQSIRGGDVLWRQSEGYEHKRHAIDIAYRLFDFKDIEVRIVDNDLPKKGPSRGLRKKA